MASHSCSAEGPYTDPHCSPRILQLKVMQLGSLFYVVSSIEKDTRVNCSCFNGSIYDEVKKASVFQVFH